MGSHYPHQVSSNPSIIFINPVADHDEEAVVTIRHCSTLRFGAEEDEGEEFLTELALEGFYDLPFHGAVRVHPYQTLFSEHLIPSSLWASKLWKSNSPFWHLLDSRLEKLADPFGISLSPQFLHYYSHQWA